MLANMSRMAALAICSALAMAISACGGDSSGDGHAAIASVQVTAGDTQSGTAGAELATPLAASVLDASGHPIVGQVVNFVVTTGGGHVFGGAETTDANGVAHERWTLGTTAGPQAVEVRAVGSDGAAVVYASFHATAVAGPVATVAVASGDGQTGTQAQALASPIVAVAKDTYGNAVSGATIALATGSGGSIAPATVVTDAAGHASATWTLGTAIGTQTATAAFAALPAATFSATATRAAPGAPTSVTVVSGDQQTIAQHTRLPQPLVVQVADALGNGVPGVSVTFAADASSGYVTPQTVVTDADGKAPWQGYVHASGSQAVVASASGLAATGLVNVTATAFTYDGVYTCTFGDGSGGGFTLKVERAEDIGNYHWVAELDHALIAPDGSYTAYFAEDLSDTVTAPGTLAVDARQKATASGTFTTYFLSTATGSGTYSCTRQ